MRRCSFSTAATGVASVRAVTVKPGGAAVQVSPCDIQTCCLAGRPARRIPPAGGPGGYGGGWGGEVPRRGWGGRGGWGGKGSPQGEGGVGGGSSPRTSTVRPYS